MHIDTNYNLKIKMGEGNTTTAPSVRVDYSKVISKTSLDTNAQAYTPETISKATTTTSELELLPRVPLGQSFSRLKIHSIKVANRDTVARTVFLYSEDEGGTEYYFVSGASVPAGATLWVAEDGSMGITPDTAGVLSVGAGSGLSNSGTSTAPILDVNVDGSTLEINSDTLRVKANGIADSHLRQGGARTVIGRSVNSTGNVADINLAADGKFLGSRASAIGAFYPTNVQSKDANYSIVQDDYGTCFVCPTTASRTLTLPSPATVGAGWWCMFKKTSTSTSNTVVIARNGSETIDGRTTSDILIAQYASAIYMTDGTNWFVMSANDRMVVTASGVTSGSSGTYKTGASMDIPPGEWLLTYQYESSATTSITINLIVISDTNNAIGGLNAAGDSRFYVPAPTSSEPHSGCISNYREIYTTTTTRYAVARFDFSGSTPTFSVRLSAQRVG